MKRTLFSILFVMASVFAVAENKVQTLYMFGFAASFSDSTVCFTDIQRVDSAYIDKKTKFLVERENYSYQLRDYLKSHDWTTPTCITMYASSRDDAEKKFVALKKKYTMGGRYTIKYIDATEFKYQAIVPTEVVYVTSSDNPTKATKDKKPKKDKSRKNGRPAPTEAGMGNGEHPMATPPNGMK